MSDGRANALPCPPLATYVYAHQKIVTSKGKNAETVISKVTLTKYAGHPQQSQLVQLRKANPPLPKLESTHKTSKLFCEIRGVGLFTVKDAVHSGILIDLSINGTPITMTLDTGASISIISEKTYKTQLPHLHLHKSDILLRTYTGETLTICGENQVVVKYKNQQYHLPLVVVEGDGPPLFGRNWIQQSILDWKEIGMVTTNLDSLLQCYHSLFKDELGTMVGVTAKFNIKPNATPKFCRARAAPYALRDVIEKDINRLQKLRVLEKVQYSDWVTPVVPVPKPDGFVRLCGDFKITINPMLQVDQHQLMYRNTPNSTTGRSPAELLYEPD